MTNDLAEVIAKEYYNDDTLDTINEVRRFISFPGIYTYGTPESDVIFVYMLISDEALEMLSKIKNIEDFTSDLTSELLQYPGDNIYVLRCIARNKVEPKKTALLMMQKHNAKSISWHDDNSVVLHTHRRV